MTTIHPVALQERRESNEAVDLIDVRTPAEYGTLHAEDAILTPLTSLDPRAVLSQRQGHEDAPLYIICQQGTRAKKALAMFEKAGFDNAVVVEGGTTAWSELGLPVVRGKKSMSLERQVRIAAGALVLLGSILGYFSSSLWIALPAFVGSGLMFAGITDTCGMAIMLAKMPWNKARASTCATTKTCATTG